MLVLDLCLFLLVFHEIKPEVPNILSEVPGEQMVEFSVTLTNQEYTPELSDPTSPQYQKLAAKIQLQVREVHPIAVKALFKEQLAHIAKHLINGRRSFCLPGQSQTLCIDIATGYLYSR